MYTVVGLVARSKGRKIRCSPRVRSARWGVPSEFWKRPWPLSRPSQTSERDSMVFGFIIAYLGRPRRIIAHEDPTRRKIYGRTRCNSPTETGRHSQINFGKRRYESGSPLAYTRKYARTHMYYIDISVRNKSRELGRAVKLYRDEILVPRSIFIADLTEKLAFNEQRERKEFYAWILCSSHNWDNKKALNA